MTNSSDVQNVSRVITWTGAYKTKACTHPRCTNDVTKGSKMRRNWATGMARITTNSAVNTRTLLPFFGNQYLSGKASENPRLRNSLKNSQLRYLMCQKRMHPERTVSDVTMRPESLGGIRPQAAVTNLRYFTASSPGIN